MVHEALSQKKKKNHKKGLVEYLKGLNFKYQYHTHTHTKQEQKQNNFRPMGNKERTSNKEVPLLRLYSMRKVNS
jgi:hypothetical protein